ncbi:MAG: winged helix DNA-binding domain-containing protein [Planctomycetota bacterium]|nr:winged helix DNA-binding domain-containing protein [Planctomycetota bacterium]
MPDIRVDNHMSRHLLLQGQGLLADPLKKATPVSIRKMIEHMGYVQVDTINIVERAHHHILMSRFEGYEKRMLWKLLEKDRKLFEHWTHDASILPLHVMPYWKHRYERQAKRLKANEWWNDHIGPNPQKVLNHVIRRIEDEGPLMSKDFEHPEQKSGPWWGWKPQKAALEYLWHTGKLCITKRVNFHKVYDLTSRVFPDHAADPRPTRRQLIDWTCPQAMQRLAIGSPSDIREFHRIVSLAEVRSWCEKATKRGEVEVVEVESMDGASKPTKQYAIHDWKKRLAKTPTPPSHMRLLSPFDPLIRDRKRLKRLFNFEYAFEAFVPEAKRTFGYYVLPILQGDRFVGRVDPKFHRDEGTLKIRKVWWEEKASKNSQIKRRAELEQAIDVFAKQLGAEKWTLPRGI